MVKNYLRSQAVIVQILHLCIALLLSACQAEQAVTQDSQLLTLTSTNTPMSVKTVTTLPTVDAPPAPTSSPLPTDTATPSPSPKPTSTRKPTLTATPTITPTPVPLGGWLVFSSQRHDTDGDGDIDLQDGLHLYSLDLVSGTLNQLTSGSAYDVEPSWSPDRSQVVFSSNRNGNFDLFIIGADGSNLQQLTNTPEGEESPVWSPNGLDIAYVLVQTLENGTQVKHLHLTSADGSRTEQLTNGPGNDSNPDWSPDGRFLVFERIEPVYRDGRNRNESNIYVLEMQTNSLFKLERESIMDRMGNGVADPQWLPREGYFLSIVQVPGMLMGVDLKVFELQWTNDEPLLHWVFRIGLPDMYTWGPNGEWFITSGDNPHPTVGTTRLERVELMLLPVSFAVPRPEAAPYSYFSYEGELITDNAFYDDYPDWAP